VKSPTGAGGAPPFSPTTYSKCCQREFGTASGNIPGTNKSIPSYLASVYVVTAASATGESATVIGATLLAESNGNVNTGANGVNSGELNNGNYSGPNNTGTLLSVDVGPMQLNTTWWSGSPLVSPQAWGTNLMPGQPFNGNPYMNVLAGANILVSLGNNPQNYVGTGNGGADAAARLKFLNMMDPKLQPFFDCLTK